ncbi:App1 family protein [Deinococcus maricopensis]|uniref:Phosphatidate phosphatase APP1 catalytic domain-containing protein n=1 Tax=Deinococcus maricopensis (strain DSM 21211 / LMG 22137 / NRRL B-23946 / LB-34) TaxID=709986 RepID=E8U9L3_DEIML|nr:phosphatase domain-containing protein [Deinococcus maricopensis]ADV67752.1 Protein of unknown function DUF2183 [Deinococcus maricopensis DSM 21211]
MLPLLERAVSLMDTATQRYIHPRRARGSLIVMPYCGWGTPHRVEVSGRVLLPRTMRPPNRADPRWRNSMNILRRLFSREVAGVRVMGTLGSVTVSSVSDGDGFFKLVFESDAPLAGGWHDATLRLEGRERVDLARVLVVAQARYGVISDLDDTVIQSDVTRAWRMLKTVFTGNARTRSPFPGVGSFYRALAREPQGRNPIFYVSSSPWNFYDLLWQFLSYRRIPLGPLFLRNWGIELLRGHGGYKHEQIERIFKVYPDLKFVLVGDSGERDPEIYAEVVHRHPNRVLAVYIRDVTPLDRDTGILKLGEEVWRAGVPMVLASDSYDAALHAMAMGLITPAELRSVIQSLERTYARA